MTTLAGKRALVTGAAGKVAPVIDFPVSPMAGFITGRIVDINGGPHHDQKRLIWRIS
jgi:hypothetical protein